jgi:hypothetical protein
MANLSISAEFLPPDLSEAGKEKVFKRMFAESGVDPLFKLNVTLFGKVAMVACWYYDGNIEGVEDFRTAARLVRLVPHLLAGRLHKLGTGDLYEYHDALGSFPDRDEDLEAVHEVVYREWSKRIKQERAEREGDEK